MSSYDTNKINVGVIKNNFSEFDSEQSNFLNVSFSNFRNGYVSNCSDAYVSRMKSKLSELYNKTSKAYKNIDNWWEDYIENVEGLENSLSSETGGYQITNAEVKSYINSNIKELGKFENKISDTMVIAETTNNLMFENNETVLNFLKYGAVTSVGGLGVGIAVAALDHSDVLADVGSVISSAVYSVGDWISGTAIPFLSDAIHSVGAFVSDTFNTVTSKVEGIVDTVGDTLSDAVNCVVSTATSIWDGFTSWVSDEAWPWIKQAATDVAEVLARVGATIANAVTCLLQGIGQFLEALVDFVFLVAGAVDTVILAIPDLVLLISGEDPHYINDLWDTVMGITTTEYVNGWFDQLYTETEFFKAMNEYSYFDREGTVGTILNGVGYIAGIVVLTIATFGAGSAVAAVGTTASGATTVAVGSTAVSGLASTTVTLTTSAIGAGGIAAAAGMGRATPKAWSEGASTTEGLLYGAARGAYEGVQMTVGYMINGLSLFKGSGVGTQALNSLSHVILDGIDGATGQPMDTLLQMIYNPTEETMDAIMQSINYDENGNQINNLTWNELSFGEKYTAMFNYNGGWQGVATNAIVAMAASGLSEIPEIGGAFRARSVVTASSDGMTKELTDKLAKLNGRTLDSFLKLAGDGKVTSEAINALESKQIVTALSTLSNSRIDTIISSLTPEKLSDVSALVAGNLLNSKALAESLKRINDAGGETSNVRINEFGEIIREGNVTSELDDTIPRFTPPEDSGNISTAVADGSKKVDGDIKTLVDGDEGTLKAVSPDVAAREVADSKINEKISDVVASPELTTIKQLDLEGYIRSVDEVKAKLENISPKLVELYENGRLSGQKLAYFLGFEEHNFIHVSRVADEALDITNKLNELIRSGDFKYYYGEIDPDIVYKAGLAHDLGMATGGYYLDDNLFMHIIDDEYGKIVRKYHPLNSAITVLQNKEIFGDDAELIACLTLIHSKSTSGVTNIASYLELSTMVETLYKNQFCDGVKVYDFDVSKLVKCNLDGTPIIENGSYVFVDGMAEQFRTGAVALRVGDAHALKTGFNHGGGQIVIEVPPTLDNELFEALSSGKYVAGDGIMDLAKMEASRAVINIDYNGRIEQLSGGDYEFSKMIVLGERNTQALESVIEDNTLVFRHIVNSSDAPACTWKFGISEKFGEYATFGELDQKIIIELPKDVDSFVENYYFTLAQNYLDSNGKTMAGLQEITIIGADGVPRVLTNPTFIDNLLINKDFSTDVLKSVADEDIIRTLNNAASIGDSLTLSKILTNLPQNKFDEMLSNFDSDSFKELFSILEEDSASILQRLDCTDRDLMIAVWGGIVDKTKLFDALTDTQLKNWLESLDKYGKTSILSNMTTNQLSKLLGNFDKQTLLEISSLNTSLIPRIAASVSDTQYVELLSDSNFSTKLKNKFLSPSEGPKIIASLNSRRIDQLIAANNIGYEDIIFNITDTSSLLIVVHSLLNSKSNIHNIMANNLIINSLSGSKAYEIGSAMGSIYLNQIDIYQLVDSLERQTDYIQTDKILRLLNQSKLNEALDNIEGSVLMKLYRATENKIYFNPLIEMYEDFAQNTMKTNFYNTFGFAVDNGKISKVDGSFRYYNNKRFTDFGKNNAMAFNNGINSTMNIKYPKYILEANMSHEAIHQISNNSYFDGTKWTYKVGLSIDGKNTGINETVTEFINELSLDRSYPTLINGNIYCGYQDAVIRLKNLVDLGFFTKENLMEAYFSNNIDYISNALQSRGLTSTGVDKLLALFDEAISNGSKSKALIKLDKYISQLSVLAN